MKDTEMSLIESEYKSFSPASRIILIESSCDCNNPVIRATGFSPASRIILIERSIFVNDLAKNLRIAGFSPASRIILIERRGSLMLGMPLQVVSVPQAGLF